MLAPEPFYSQCRDKTYAWDRPTPQTMEKLPDWEKNGVELFGGTGDHLKGAGLIPQDGQRIAPDSAGQRLKDHGGPDREPVFRLDFLYVQTQ